MKWQKAGYNIYIYKNDELIKETVVPWQVIDASDDYVGTQYYQSDVVYVEGNIYKFEIVAIKTSNFKNSDTTTIYYPKEKNNKYQQNNKIDKNVKIQYNIKGAINAAFIGFLTLDYHGIWI